MPGGVYPGVVEGTGMALCPCEATVKLNSPPGDEVGPRPAEKGAKEVVLRVGVPPRYTYPSTVTRDSRPVAVSSFSARA